jgi:alpha-ribazole phosphatase
VEHGVTAACLWVVRHAPVSVRGICYGQSDVPTETDDAAAAEAVLAQLEVSDARALERIWTSPWRRTRGIAEALGARMGVEIDVDPRLSELSFGVWEGRSYAALEADDGARFAAWMSDWEHAAPPGGERVADLVARLDAWRRSLGSRRGIAITHAGPIRTLRALARGVGHSEVVGEPVEPLHVERLVFP